MLNVPTQRDSFIDLLRAGSVAIVVLAHWLGPRVILTDDGFALDLIASGPVAWVASWFFQIMPVIFLAGGVANAAVVGKMRLRGQPYAEFLAIRARRLVAPAAALIVVMVVVTGLAVALGWPSIGEAISIGTTQPLWFISVYLTVTALAPAMVVAHQRFGLMVPLVLAICAVIVDAIRFNGVESAATVNLLFVWLFAHQLGIAYGSGAMRDVRGVTLLAVVAIAVAICVAATVWGPYPPSMIGLRDAPVSNLAPPTAMLAVLATAQLAVITWVGRRVGPTLYTPRWQRRLGMANRPIMTVYLWHVPAVIMLGGLLLLAPRPLQSLLPHIGLSWWFGRPVWLLLCALILAGMLFLFLRFEAITFPSLPKSVPQWAFMPLAVAGSASAVLGIYLIWRDGVLLTGPGAGARLMALLALGLSLFLLCPPVRVKSPS